MLRLSIRVLGFLAASTAVAVGACPASVPGSASEAIRANQARILCLQAEINAQTNQRWLELELSMQRAAIQRLQLQRRFDKLQFQKRQF